MFISTASRPPGLKRVVRAGEHAPVLLVREVAERREPAEHAVEPPAPRDRAHVALDVLDLDAALGRIRPRQLEKQRRRVEPRHPHAALRERVCDPPVPAREIEQLEARLELEQPPDELDLRRRPLGSQQLLVEVEVVLVEGFLARELRSPSPKSCGAANGNASSEG